MQQPIEICTPSLDHQLSGYWPNAKSSYLKYLETFYIQNKQGGLDAKYINFKQAGLH